MLKKRLRPKEVLVLKCGERIINNSNISVNLTIQSAEEAERANMQEALSGTEGLTYDQNNKTE